MLQFNSVLQSSSPVHQLQTPVKYKVHACMQGKRGHRNTTVYSISMTGSSHPFAVYLREDHGFLFPGMYVKGIGSGGQGGGDDTPPPPPKFQVGGPGTAPSSPPPPRYLYNEIHCSIVDTAHLCPLKEIV